MISIYNPELNAIMSFSYANIRCVCTHTLIKGYFQQNLQHSHACYVATKQCYRDVTLSQASKISYDIFV